MKANRVFAAILEELGEWFYSMFIKDMHGHIGMAVRRMYWIGIGTNAVITAGVMVG